VVRTEREAIRDSRIFLACCIALISAGLLLVAWGLTALSELPRLQEASQARNRMAEAGQPIPEVGPVSLPQRIAQIKATGTVTVLAGAVAMLGGVLVVGPGQTSRRHLPPT
jgi:hypothetical protein